MAPDKKKIAKACKAMQNLGYLDKTVKPILTNLLKLYGNKWKLIEEGNYRVLVDAVLDSEEQKAQDDNTDESFDWFGDDDEDEDEDNEPLLKRFKRNRHENPSSSMLDNAENQGETAYDVNEGEDAKLKAPSSSKSGHEEEKRKTSSSPLFHKAIKLNSPPKLLAVGSSSKKCSNAKQNCSFFPEVVDMESEDTRPSLPKEASSVSEGNQSVSTNYEQPRAENDETGPIDNQKLSIASSSKGEVKITLTFNSPLRSAFRVSSFEEVLKQVEVPIPQTGFSIKTLMNDVCESFLAAGTTSTHTENGNSKASNSLIVSDECHDRQLILYDKSVNQTGPSKSRGTYEISPELSSDLGPFELDLCRKVCNELGRKNMEPINLLPSSSKNMFVKKQQYHYIEDISKGHEDLEVSLINEVNNEPHPTFIYITKNVVYQNAYLKFLLALIPKEKCCANCSGDCLSLAIPCACASDIGGQFAYAPGGLVTDRFLASCSSTKHSEQKRSLFYCKECPLKKSIVNSLSGKCDGHVVRKFIKECWYKCSCSMICGNRIVQQGIRVKLQVFMTSEGKGWGLRTLKDIPKGSFVCEYVGEVLTSMELVQRKGLNHGGKHTYCVVLDAGWKFEGTLKDEKALCLDASGYGNAARFINHRCSDANLVEIPVQVETPDHHYYYHLALFTTKEVKALEELTWDYGTDFNDRVKAFECHCGSNFCRDKKTTRRTDVSFMDLSD